MDAVLAALRRPGAGAEERAKAVRCLSERRGQMRYGEYRSRGIFNERSWRFWHLQLGIAPIPPLPPRPVPT